MAGATPNVYGNLRNFLFIKLNREERAIIPANIWNIDDS